MILDSYELTLETQKQQFWVLQYKVGDRPKTLVTTLQECATRWLLPNTQGKRDIVDKVVLEQVCYAVPVAVRTWLMGVGPASLDQATACLENYSLAERAGTLAD